MAGSRTAPPVDRRDRDPGESPALFQGVAARSRTLALLPWFLVAAPLVVVPGLVDFARFPQQAFIQIATALLMVVWAREGTRSGPGGVRRLDAPVALFIGLSALSLVGAADRVAGLEVLAHWVSCALVYGMVSRLVLRPAQARTLLAGLFGGAALVALTGLAQALLAMDLIPSAAGPAGTLANRNVAAGYLVMALPLGLALWRTSGAVGRRAVLTGAAAILAFLPFTLARVAAVALALQLLVLALAHPGRAARRGAAGLWTTRRLAPTVAAAVLVVAVAGLTLASPAKARSLHVRASLAQAALSMAQENPVLGLGLGSFDEEYARFGEPIRVAPSSLPLSVGSAHSEPLHVFAEAGLPALIALLWIVVSTVLGLARLRRSGDAEVRITAWAIGLSCIGLAVDGAFAFPLRTSVGPLGAAVLLGIVASLDGPQQRRTSPRSRHAAHRGGPRLLPPILAALLLAPAVAWSVHQGADPPAPQQPPPDAAACSPTIALELRGDDRLDLTVTDALLADVLDCLGDRTTLRVEVDGALPRERVSAAFEDEAPARIVTQLLNGLGVDYLLGFDPSGVHLQRVIIVEDSTPRGGSRPAPEPEPSLEPAFSDEDQGAVPGEGGPGPAAFPRPGATRMPGALAVPGAGPIDSYGEPGWEEVDPGYDPEPMEPAELSPMTLRRVPAAAPAVVARSGPDAKGT